MKCRSQRVALLSVLLTIPAYVADRSAAASKEDADDRSHVPGLVKTSVGRSELKIFTSDQRMNLDQSDIVTLSVYFMLTSPFEVLQLRLPPGFDFVRDPDKGCGVYTKGSSADGATETSEAKEFSQRVKARHLPPQITKHGCKVTEPVYGPAMYGGEVTADPVTVTIQVKKDVPGLSEVAPVPDDRPEEEKTAWWCFAINVRNPSVNPVEKDNQFSLFHYHTSNHWNGAIVLRGWEIYGDWECKYSEWEGWGQCSAMCGGGEMRLTRRVVSQPPPRREGNFKTCDEELTKTVPCNQFACKFQCELVDVQEESACSAECGGGVKPIRSRWRGEGCPKKDDYESIRYENCNPEPCKVRCLLSDSWTVVTGCSEVCGEGTYRMMREVLQKDTDDPACVPEWREVKCVREWCSQLTIIRPDRNVLPYPSDTYYVGIAFKTTFAIRELTLMAPVGYSFGKPGSDCFIHDHDLVPAYKGCKVGTKSPDGKWDLERSITILLKGILGHSGVGRYHFMLPVTNAKCSPSAEQDKWMPAVTIGNFEDQGDKAEDHKINTLPKEVCYKPYDQNMWEMQLFREVVTEGHQPIFSIWANGYELHNPEESRKGSTAGDKSSAWDTANGNDYMGLENNNWIGRVVYCSPRLEPCPNEEVCPASGVCPQPIEVPPDRFEAFVNAEMHADSVHQAHDSSYSMDDSSSDSPSIWSMTSSQIDQEDNYWHPPVDESSSSRSGSSDGSSNSRGSSDGSSSAGTDSQDSSVPELSSTGTDSSGSDHSSDFDSSSTH